jgi:hypothetical protein
MNVFGIQVFSNLLGRFIAVHERHVAIHQDEIVLAFSEVLRDVFFNLLDCLLAVEAVVTNRFHIDPKTILKNDDDRFDVELLIIDDQNTVLNVS